MTRIYRLLLRLYPAGFRREFGDEMLEAFAERTQDAGTATRIALGLEAVMDTLANAIPLHLEILRQDLRYAARALRRSPGFAFTAIAVTALAVGANTAAFSVADFVLRPALPYADGESLVRLCAGPRTGPTGWGCNNQLSPADYRDLRDRSRSFESLGAFMRGATNLVGVGEPQRLPSASVTSDVLPLLGVQPLLGAWPADEASVAIGHELWRSLFGGDAAALGQTVRLDGAVYTVAAVMPPGFHFPSRETMLWLPLRLDEEAFAQRNNNYLEAVGRLAPGVTFERAHAELRRLTDRLAAEYPETNEETGVSFFRMSAEYSPAYALMLRTLCGAALCILLLACANLANLLLVRAGARERELAVRSALGAGRERLVRQMVTESALLAAIGGAVGVAVAWLTFPLLALLVPATLPIGSAPQLDGRVLALAAAFACATGFGFGIVPALRAGRGSSADVLRAGRSGSWRRRRPSALVAVEVAACVILLVSCGLLVRATLRVQSVESGFRPDGVLAVRTVLPKPEYESTPKREQFYQAVLRGVRALPGVESAAYASGLPMVMTGGIARVTLPGEEVRRDGNYTVSRRYVTPQFFRTLGIPLLAGRDLEDGDGARGRVAVVSRSFAERYWPGEDPIGRRFLFQDSLRTVVGVVGEVRVRGLERASEPQMYMPSSDIGDTPLAFHDPKELVIRTSGNEHALLPAVREIVRRADPGQPISDVTTLAAIVSDQTAQRRAQIRLLAALATLAIVLAALGIHGLLAYTVAQRRQEIAVRLALGARPGRIARAILGNGVRLVVVGVIPGLLIAAAAGYALRTMLFGVPPIDPVTIVVALAVCLAVAITGAGIPALRAVRVSPLNALREE